MKPKTFKVAIAILIIAILIFLTNGIIKKANAIETIQQARKVLPDFKFQNLKGLEFNQDSLNQQLLSMVIAFNPDCQFCQYEAKAIQENLKAFKMVNLLLVSHTNKEETLSFGKEYNLLNQPNVYLVLNKADEFYRQFGERTFPTILIYNEQQELVKIFKGETKISAILNLINAPRTKG